MTPPGAGTYPHLFSPLALGRLKLPNRFTIPGLTTNYATHEGFVTDALCTYLAARARGGFGLIVTENLGVHPSGRVMPRMAMIDDDRYVPGLARLAASVQREGGLVVGQLSHAGRQTKSRITGLPLVAPSAIPCPINREAPRALAVDEIRELEQAFVSAAVRLAAAGYDGVEIHGAHGYLVGGFLSRYSNRRDDVFGGSLDNRMRFLLDIVDGIQRALGRDFPLIVRLSAREFVPDGLDLPETIEIARRLRDRGVHALSVSVGVYESFNKLSMVSGEPEGQWLPLAAAIRSATGLPTIGVGRVKRARVAEEALASGQIDLAVFGRASIADPDLPRKVREGEESRILWCFGCNVCLGRTARPETICPVNPAVGREATFAPAPAARPVRLAIHGTSVSALTAAWVAAQRGHAVTVYEPGPALGGLQGLRARVPGQEGDRGDDRGARRSRDGGRREGGPGRGPAGRARGALGGPPAGARAGQRPHGRGPARHELRRARISRRLRGFRAGGRVRRRPREHRCGAPAGRVGRGRRAAVTGATSRSTPTRAIATWPAAGSAVAARRSSRVRATGPPARRSWSWSAVIRLSRTPTTRGRRRSSPSESTGSTPIWATRTNLDA